MKFNLANQQTNLHIIIENMNKMSYDFICLLYKSNYELTLNNTKYADVIINIEKNVSNLFEKYFDYSGIFTESLNHLYFQISDFTMQFLEDLLKLIDEVHSNYSLILSKGQNDSYEFINEIRIITKKSYIEYVQNMIQNLEIFNNKTLYFLNGIEEETMKIEIFQIDLLYDIIDLIYDTKLIFRNFNNNLFKAIEKGILTFKYDLLDYIENIIGELLYITDFLSINLNKNEIFRKAIDSSQRNITTQKLKDFRNIIIVIMDVLINKIYDDYNNEIASNNSNNIKYHSENSVELYINNIQSNSDKVSELIKAKINYINLYETYSDIINKINSYFREAEEEFNNDIYNKIIKNMSVIIPKYLNKKNSLLIKNRQVLFNKTKEMVFTINNDINIINDNALSLSNNYLEENLYSLHKDLYNIKKSFSDDKLNKLLKDFVLIIENTMKIDFIKLIDENYELAYDYMKESDNVIARINGNAFIGTGFITMYQNYFKNFKEFMMLSFSDEFIEILEGYFYKIKDDIMNYINKKIDYLNKYNFSEEFIKNNFYLMIQINQEIKNIIDNLNNFFNEENFMMEVKLTVLNIGTEVIKPYDENKEKKLTNLYDSTRNRLRNEVHGTNADFAKRVRYKKRFHRYFVFYDYYCNNRNNIDKININLSKIENIIFSKLNSLINEYINDFSSYIIDYANISEKLYETIYNFYKIKINEHQNINNLITKYEESFDSMFNKINEDLIIYENFNFNKELKFCLNKLEKNIINIQNEFYINYYMNNYENFLEYPDEINFKINQYKTELEYNIENIKHLIEKTYANKIYNSLQEIKYFIQDMHNFNYQYLITNLNYTNQTFNNEYFKEKMKIINNNFTEYASKIDKKLNEINISANNENILFNKDLNGYIENIKNNYSNFVLLIKDIIDQNFTVEKCEESFETYSDSIIKTGEYSSITDLMNCHKEIKKSELNYSKYNFNTVKIRKEIYFTKTLLSKIDLLFDDINYNSMINIEKINEYDNQVNNKNILDIYNKTKTKQKQIIIENKFLLDNEFESFILSLKDYYNIEDEVLPLYEIFQEIIRNENYNYSNYIFSHNKKLLNDIKNILDELKKVLENQISLKYEYDYFNIDKNYFNNTYKSYYSIIENIFNKYKEKIIKLKENKLFYNSLKSKVRKYKFTKSNYIKNLFNIYLIKKGYKFEFFGKNYDLGDNIKKFLDNEYINYEFNLIYYYFELFENNTEIYAKNIIKQISAIENNIKDNFSQMYLHFMNLFEKGANETINYQYYIDHINNKNICNEYKGKNINESIKRDLIAHNFNEEEVKNILEECYFDLTEFIFKNSEKNLSNKNENETLDENDNKNFRYNCLDINDKILDYCNVKQFLKCVENNKFNSSIFFFNNIHKDIKIKLDEIFEKIESKIQENYLDEKFIYDYLMNDKNIEEKYELEINAENFEIYFENIYEASTYINSFKESEYKKYLKSILIENFNKSYLDLKDKYIINELKDNVTIYINNKLEIFINYISEKIYEEYQYFIFLLSKIDELGYATNIAIINLFNYFFEIISESINYTIENEINFYLDIFYRENKAFLRKNFINYLYRNENEYNINIYNIKNYLDELMIDRNFNKSLDNISYELIKNITSGLQLSIKDLANKKMSSLFISLKNHIQTLEKIISKKAIINITDEMTSIYNLIQTFQTTVKNQSNRFNFKVGIEPFNSLHNFIEIELRPPLLLIRNKYNFIEEQISEEIIKIVNDFPDCYSLVKDNFINNRIEDIYNYINKINETILEYKDKINEDIELYINKLSFYTLINGLITANEPCNQSFCMLNHSRGETNRRLNEEHLNNKSQYNFSFSKKNKNNSSKNNNWRKNKNIFMKRKLKEYDPSNPGLSRDDVLEYIEEIKNTILNFDKLYLQRDYKHIKSAVQIYLIKMNGTCLDNLKRSFHIKLEKFSTLITQERMEFLKAKIMAQYYLIEPFIHDRANFIQELINNFTQILNNTKVINKMISELIYQKLSYYYDILTDNIQSRYDIIDIYGFRSLEKENKFKDMTYYKYAEYFEGYINKLNEHLTVINNRCFEIEHQITTSLKNVLNNFFNFTEGGIFTKIGTMMKTFIKYLDGMRFIPIKPVFIPLPILPFLYLDTYFYTKFGYKVDIEPILENTVGLSTDLYVQAEFGVNLDVGIYIPKPNEWAPIRIYFSAGMNGILISGRAGLKINLYLVAEKYETDLYFIFKTFNFEFYVRYGIKINLYHYKRHFDHDIYRYIYNFTKPYEKHKKKLHDMKFFDLRSKILLQDEIKNVINDKFHL